ncbi:SPRY domain-containing protein [Thalassospira permensis]|nr:SPRY domain-containing protein [Thalassospira permensis]
MSGCRQPFHRHIILDVDNPIASERIQITIDGIRQSVDILTAVAVVDLWANVAGIPFFVGVNSGFGSANLYRNEIGSETAWFDGFAPAATEFGYFNTYGDWVPKAFSGKGEGAAVYGVNGFHLDYADPLDLGKDVSGNANHLSAFGLTVDNQVTDTPTNNFAVGNPLDAPVPSGRILSEGNTSWQPANNAGEGHIASTILIPAEKYYWEVTVEAGAPFTPSTIVPGIGFAHSSVAVNEADGSANGLFHYQSNGNIIANPWGSATGYPTWTVGDVIRVAIDRKTGDCWFAKGIDWISGDPEAGTDPAFTIPADWLDGLRASVQDSAASGAIKAKVNFGQFAFDYPMPTGFRTLSSAGMPCPEILKPDNYFTTRIVTGGASVSDLPFNPTIKALVVSKCIDADEPCVVTDTVNGAGFAWETSSAVNGIAARPQGLIAFTANGYAIGSDTAYQGNRLDLIWRASPKAGFDIVTVDHTTGTPTTVPQLSGGVIEYGWVVRNNAGQTRRMFHHLLGNDRYFPMNAAGGPVTDAGWFSSTANTVTLGASLPTGIYTLYVWRSVPQFSSFGRYAPNDSNNGPFLPLDFLPRLFQPNGGGPNGTRSIFVDDLVVNGGNDPRLAFEAAAEAVTAYEYCDFLSNGVKARGVYTPINYSDTDYYYPAAWARTPGKFARAR